MKNGATSMMNSECVHGCVSMRGTKILLALVALAALATAASAQQQRQYYDSSGKTVGRSTTDSQGSSTFYDAGGRVSGRTFVVNKGTPIILGPCESFKAHLR
jgi:YD repeat-containing protein